MNKEKAVEKSFQQCVIEYERLLASGDATQAMTWTITLLDGLQRACSAGGFVEKAVPTTSREHWYTRAAAALTRFITAPTTTITNAELPKITQRKQLIVYIFAASGFRNMTHLIDQMVETSASGEITISNVRAPVLFAFAGLDDLAEPVMTLALAMPVSVLRFFFVGWLNQRAVLTEQGEKNRSRLLTSGHLLESAVITDPEIPTIINAWMYSSYAAEPDKHQIKKWLNHLLINRMKTGGVKPLEVVHKVKSRPKMIIVLERFTRNHAMYRCYAAMIQSVGTYFDTVAISDEVTIDDVTEQLFDEVVRLSSPRPSIAALTALIQAREPDVIFYPSLGMSHWTVMLALLRLAPIQVMSHGHPATSMMDTIDFAYTPEFEGDLTAIHSEKIITGPSEVYFESHPNLPTELPKLVSPSDREVRIAVNSKVMKLSWRLLHLCKRLEKESEVPISFSFFPGELHLFMDGLDAAIRAHLPTATVVPYVDYAHFLKELSKCDFALAAFPFGNTNSTVDTCLLGLPTVAHFGAEPPSQTDSLVLKMSGLAEWLICRSDEEYFRTALRLANDPVARTTAMAGQSRATMYQRLISDRPNLGPDVFGETMFRLHKDYDRLKSSTQRQLRHTDLIHNTL